MLYRFGKPSSRPAGKASLGLHRVAGYAAMALLLLMLTGMVARTAFTGAAFSARGAWHAAAGLLLGAVLLAKWAAVRPWRGLLKFAPALGLTLFALTFATVNLTATINLVASKPPAIPAAPAGAPGADVAVLRTVVAEKCGKCHHLEQVFHEKRDPAAWREVVTRMRGYDPAWISDEDGRSIERYLVAEY
jgi:uncharacterized membrane protein